MMTENIFDQFNNEKSNISNLRSLCIEAGFNETDLVSTNTNNNREDVGFRAVDPVLELTKRVVDLEEEINCLKKENACYLNALKHQKDSHEFLAEKIKQFELFVNTIKTKDVKIEESSAAVDAVNLETSEKEKKQVDFKTEVNSLLSDVTSINKKMDIYSSHLTDISKVVYKIESEVQKFIRRHSLVIENLCPKEDSSAMEMLLVFARSVLNVKLEDYDIESLQIIEKIPVEPIPGTPEKRALPRPVLVTFTCYKVQAQIYKAWLSFRCKNTPGSLSKERGQGITIKEYLTENQDNIYNDALKLKEKHLIIDCWTYKGKTYIKKLDNSVSEFSHSSEIVPKSESSSCTVM